MPFLVLPFLIACGEVDLPLEEEEKLIEEEVVSPQASKPIELPTDLFYYQLTSTRDEIDLRPYTYFGGFYAERLRFYHLKYPGINFRGAEVKEIYLYFIDDYLVKVRYEFADDILSRITDYMQSGGQDLNETLRISWSFPNRQVMYNRVYVGDTHTYYLYEEIHGYKKLVREAERSSHGVLIKSSESASEP